MAQLQFITRAYFSTTHTHTHSERSRTGSRKTRRTALPRCPFPNVLLPSFLLPRSFSSPVVRSRNSVETPNKSTETESKVGGVMCDGRSSRRRRRIKNEVTLRRLNISLCVYVCVCVWAYIYTCVCVLLGRLALSFTFVSWQQNVAKKKQ